MPRHKIDRRRRGLTRPATKPAPAIDPLSFNGDDDDSGVPDSPSQGADQPVAEKKKPSVKNNKTKDRADEDVLSDDSSVLNKSEVEEEEEEDYQVAEKKKPTVKQDKRKDRADEKDVLSDDSSVLNESEVEEEEEENYQVAEKKKPSVKQDKTKDRVDEKDVLSDDSSVLNESEVEEEEEEEDDDEEPDNKDDEDYQEESSEDNDDDSSDDEDAYEPVSEVSRRRKQPARRRKQIDSYNEEEEEEEEHLESDEDSVVEPHTRKTRARTTNRGQRQRGKRRARSSRRRNRDDLGDSSDEEEGYHGTPASRSPRRTTPSRASATRANKKLEETFTDSDDEEEGDVPLSMVSPKKRKKDIDEEEYVVDKDEEEEEEDEEELSVEEEDSLLEDALQSKNVDDESLFSADESNDDDEKQAPSPTLDIRYARRKRRRVVDSSDDDDDDASVSDFRTTPGQKVAGTTSSRKQAPPKLPDCPSETDVVTFEELPDKHVCYIPPDQSSRQCFALETLHKIALTSKLEFHGKDGRQTFLQPPHFRSAMSDDLVDQIASRFGRAALDLHGYFYNGKKQGSSQFSNESGGSSRTRGEDYEYMVNFDGTLADTKTFLDRLNEYMSHLMGHQDIYCCPLCYTEAHRRLSNQDSDDDESDFDVNGREGEDEEDFVFTHDPMSILGYLDNDEFILASTFCFPKIVEVKRHLRDAHGVDTSVLDGTGLFKRFKIRESDGLLQRYLEQVRDRTYQGNMRSYWSSGFNQMYIQLLHLMKRTRILKENLENHSQNDSFEIEEDGRALVDRAETFVRSFERRGKRLWDSLSSPYRKAMKEELEDFIVEEDDYEGDDVPPNPVFNPDAIESSATPEEQIIEALRKRRKRDTNFSQPQSDSDERESDAYSENSGDDAISPTSEHARAEYYSEEEEEEDEWVKNLRERRPSRRPSKTDDSKKGVQNHGKGKSVGTPALRKPASRSKSSSTKKHRRIIESDEDE